MKLDVAIIGASSSGLYAAEQLAGAGKQVAVFEQQADLSPARRTLIITPQLRQILGVVPEEAILHRIHTMALATPAADVRISLHDPDLIVERCQLAQMLADRAARAGAQIRYGYRFQSIESHPDGALLCLHTADQGEMTITARAVIGADGVVSDVARAVGLRRPATVPILQAEVRLPQGWNPDVTQVWFDTAETRFFYWLIPESAEYGVVGLVGDDGAETRTLLQQFLARHEFQALAYQGAQVAMYDRQLRPWAQVGSAPVLLVGDAAGQVKVTTVGGTVSGIWGAAAAARTLLQGTTYAQELRGLQRELNLHWLIRELLDCADNANYNRLVRSITPDVQQFFSQYNRDEMAGRLWPLLARRPALVALGMRLLRRRFLDLRRQPSKAMRAVKTE